MSNLLNTGALLALDQTHEMRVTEKGIYAYGYGKLSVIAMTDPRLTTYDKGIFAFFAAYCGDADGMCTCRQKTVLNALKIGAHTYGASVNHLMQYGYLLREREYNGPDFGPFRFKVVQNPDNKTGWLNIPRYTPAGMDTSFHVPYDRYGCISKLVMHDSRLSIREKALYAVICALAGPELSITCPKDLLQQFSGASNAPVAHYLKNLTFCGYLERVSHHNGNRGYSASEYHVISHPKHIPYPKAFAAQDKRRVMKECENDVADAKDVNSILGRTLGKTVSPKESLELSYAAIESAASESGSYKHNLSEGKRKELSNAIRERIAVEAPLDGFEIVNGCVKSRTSINPNNLKTPAEELILELMQLELTDNDRRLLDVLAHGGIPEEYADKGQFTKLKESICDYLEYTSVTSTEDANILREIVKSIVYLSSSRKNVVINGRKNEPKKFLQKLNSLIRSFTFQYEMEKLISRVKNAIYKGGVHYLPSYINHSVWEVVMA